MSQLIPPSVLPILLLFASNVFMTFAWYGHLKYKSTALPLDGDRVTGEERLLATLGERIRDVREGPDGALWLLTDAQNGRVLRVAPAGR